MNGEAEEDAPWAGLYRRALMCGIADGAFWTMSPAALVAITRGMEPARRGGGRGAYKRAPQTSAPHGPVGGLCDCP